MLTFLEYDNIMRFVDKERQQGHALGELTKFVLHDVYELLLAFQDLVDFVRDYSFVGVKEPTIRADLSWLLLNWRNYPAEDVWEEDTQWASKSEWAKGREGLTGERIDEMIEEIKKGQHDTPI